jgi:hypothetical protein
VYVTVLVLLCPAEAEEEAQVLLETVPFKVNPLWVGRTWVQSVRSLILFTPSKLSLTKPLEYAPFQIAWPGVGG